MKPAISLRTATRRHCSSQNQFAVSPRVFPSPPRCVDASAFMVLSTDPMISMLRWLSSQLNPIPSMTPKECLCSTPPAPPVARRES